MPAHSVLHIRQDAPVDGKYPIRLTLQRAGQADLEAQANIAFGLTPQEQKDLRWYLEDYLQLAESTSPAANSPTPSAANKSATSPSSPNAPHRLPRSTSSKAKTSRPRW